MGEEGSGREDRRGRTFLILTCWGCDGLGFRAPRIAAEVCLVCAGHGRMRREPGPEGRWEPLEPHDQSWKSAWTVSRHDWIYGASQGEAEVEDEAQADEGDEDWPDDF